MKYGKICRKLWKTWWVSMKKTQIEHLKKIISRANSRSRVQRTDLARHKVFAGKKCSLSLSSLGCEGGWAPEISCHDHKTWDWRQVAHTLALYHAGPTRQEHNWRWPRQGRSWEGATGGEDEKYRELTRFLEGSGNVVGMILFFFSYPRMFRSVQDRP